MQAFIYRCPNTSFRVQSWVANDVPDDKNTYEAVTCTACLRQHLVNAATGKVLGANENRQTHTSLKEVSDRLAGWYSFGKAAGRTFACPHCGTRYEVTYTGVTDKDRGLATCTKCHKVMTEWNDAFSRVFKLKLG